MVIMKLLALGSGRVGWRGSSRDLVGELSQTVSDLLGSGASLSGVRSQAIASVRSRIGLEICQLDMSVGCASGDRVLGLCISRIFRKESKKNVTVLKVDPVRVRAI